MIPQIERAQPETRELDIVLIAPAPGVKEMSAPAATRVSQTDHDMAGSVEPRSHCSPTVSHP